VRDFVETFDGFVHQPKNTLPLIKEIWAFVSVDPDDGNEGMVARDFGKYLTPLIAADKERLKEMWPHARYIANRFNVKVRLVKLTTREVVVEDVMRGNCPDKGE
jgi:hypothetical protein